MERNDARLQNAGGALLRKVAYALTASGGTQAESDQQASNAAHVRHAAASAGGRRLKSKTRLIGTGRRSGEIWGDSNCKRYNRGTAHRGGRARPVLTGTKAAILASALIGRNGGVIKHSTVRGQRCDELW